MSVGLWWLLSGFIASFGMLRSGTLVVEVSNVEEPAGMVWVGLYDAPDHFLDKEKALLKGVRIQARGTLSVSLRELPFGRYAVAVFHDRNNNGVLDQNFLGIPKEPFAFSRPTPSRWRLPRFEEVAFTFGEEKQVLHTALKPWRKH